MKQLVSLWVLGGALALSACSKQGSDAPKAQPEAKPEVAQVAPVPLEVSVQNAWVRPTVVGQKATGAYFTLTANQDARVLSGSTPVAASLELHEMKIDGDVMRMRKLDNGIPLPANQAVELKPGGYHVMLLDLTQAVHAGQEVSMTLVVQKSEQSGGGTQEVVVKALVRSIDSDASTSAAPAPAQGEHHH